jgi:hypothetical protein
MNALEDFSEKRRKDRDFAYLNSAKGPGIDAGGWIAPRQVFVPDRFFNRV